MTSLSSVPSGESFVGSMRQEYAGTKTSLGHGSMVPVTKKTINITDHAKSAHKADMMCFRVPLEAKGAVLNSVQLC